jgi:[acyl-carrier-protein] S-malonyltransferase
MNDQGMTSAPAILLCPGQGAQHVGMAKAWADRFPIAAEVLAEADRVLGVELSKLCYHGPEEQLNRTDISQPAIYTASVASFRALREQKKIGEIAATAGLSLGEFTALHLAGAFSFEAGLRLVRKRGQYMQEAAEGTPGGMVALVGADEAQATLVCEQTLEKGKADEVLVPANFNCPGQVVISGSLQACYRAIETANAMGVKATPLKVAGAFHSPLMQPAAERLAKALDAVEWQRPSVPVISNVTAKPHDAHNIDSVKKRLVEQLTSPVRWEQSMVWVIAHTPGRYVELAPNKVLSGLMRRIDRQVKVENHAEPAAAASGGAA